METVAEFNDNKGFNVKLTNEKIFIEASGISETIALRGLNGVGLYDNIEKFDLEMEQYKASGKGWKIFKSIFLLCAGLMLFLGLVEGDAAVFFPAIMTAGFAILMPKIFSAKKEEPVLDSYFRLMLSGGDRKFKFNKSDDSSDKIADFINKVEDTLTAYK
tara:strand:+ start:146 stop:625 length:480 start_codon:yes stop_codon:yes gene_type:complete